MIFFQLSSFRVGKLTLMASKTKTKRIFPSHKYFYCKYRHNIEKVETFIDLFVYKRQGFSFLFQGQILVKKRF